MKFEGLNEHITNHQVSGLVEVTAGDVSAIVRRVTRVLFSPLMQRELLPIVLHRFPLCTPLCRPSGMQFYYYIIIIIKFKVYVFEL